MKFKPSVLRTVTAATFVVLVVVGLAFHTGWGTLSSFGIGAIAAICPLGAIEMSLADGSLLPRVLIGFIVFLLVTAQLRGQKLQRLRRSRQKRYG